MDLAKAPRNHRAFGHCEREDACYGGRVRSFLRSYSQRIFRKVPVSLHRRYNPRRLRRFNSYCLPLLGVVLLLVSLCIRRVPGVVDGGASPTPHFVQMAMPQVSSKIGPFLARASRLPDAGSSASSHSARSTSKRRGRPPKSHPGGRSTASAAHKKNPSNAINASEGCGNTASPKAPSRIRGRPRKRACPADPISAKDRNLLLLALQGTTGDQATEAQDVITTTVSSSEDDSYYPDERAPARRSLATTENLRSLEDNDPFLRPFHTIGSRDLHPADLPVFAESLPPASPYFSDPSPPSEAEGTSSSKQEGEPTTRTVGGRLRQIARVVKRIFSPPEESKPNSPPPNNDKPPKLSRHHPHHQDNHDNHNKRSSPSTPVLPHPPPSDTPLLACDGTTRAPPPSPPSLSRSPGTGTAAETPSLMGMGFGLEPRRIHYEDTFHEPVISGGEKKRLAVSIGGTESVERRKSATAGVIR